MHLPRPTLAPLFSHPARVNALRPQALLRGAHQPSGEPAPISAAAVAAWAESVLEVPHHAHDNITLSTALKLYATLPTRSGPIYSTPPPTVAGLPFGPGHHLVLFPPIAPEAELNPDGTEPMFTPPLPWSRRMWAGGEMEWVPDNELRIGDAVKCESAIDTVEEKGWRDDKPKLFVWQRHKISNNKGVALVDRRAHVFQPMGVDGEVSQPRDKPNPDLPDPDFSVSFTPSDLTLFRFSALTFNAHKIHYDAAYAKSEGHPGPLVHGPLTALLLLEAANFLLPPSGRFLRFRYRAVRPLVVGKEITFLGSWRPGARGELTLWAQDDEGRVGMWGEAHMTGLH
ncbi:Thioesterase/thiol ester dehydrase-isomerase [Dacryopinax primogenitus]|uniref:Thioesterase/thiol ester dehydrase-isomerase n=1 Tax=Dacryopinax primogenitus (strain DJM 731) TaxID=1858805 RepID=M5G431_DACPD|nr:Thioesterase/thiol ester dehydrase-isomerase [Dacryopinax primogenitus]EJU05021.1 Thioesterase/thiol ester dehydrase-isomerase [Dacryopinax primogenitus]